MEYSHVSRLQTGRTTAVDEASSERDTEEPNLPAGQDEMDEEEACFVRSFN